MQACSSRPELTEETGKNGFSQSGLDSAGTEPGFESPLEEVDGVDYLHLPVLFIDTRGQSIGNTDKIDADLDVIRLHDGTHTDLSAATRSFAGAIGIEIHGSSSQGYPKQGYRFETRDEYGDDVDVSLLGLNKGSDWVLHAPYGDKTLLRNALAYALGQQLGADTGEYQPGAQLCELYLNGSYNGVYLLVERVKRGGDRVDIARVSDSAADGDITGGYILKLDQGRNSYWTTPYGNHFSYVYPRYEAITSEQNSYIQSWFAEFESMFWGPSWNDPVNGYSAWIHVDSFVDHFILYELSHNIDAYRLSTYFYKEADEDGGLLHAGPIWDFDRAYGNVNYCNCQNTSGWIHDSLDSCGCYYQFAEYWPRLLQDEAFTTQLRCRWESLRQAQLSDTAIQSTWQGLVRDVTAAEARDHERWPVIGTWVDPNSFVGATWEEEIEWMDTWIQERTLWLDTYLPGSCG